MLYVHVTYKPVVFSRVFHAIHKHVPDVAVRHTSGLSGILSGLVQPKTKNDTKIGHRKDDETKLVNKIDEQKLNYKLWRKK